MIRPLLHFEAVGHLLQICVDRSSASKTAAASLFHRIAFESYLYHVSMLSLFYPETDRYTELAPHIERELHTRHSGIDQNIVTALDINIYRVLFASTLLARTDQSRSGYPEKLEATKALLETISSRASENLQDTSTPSTETEFWRLSSVASNALFILLLKVENRSLLPTDDRIRNHLTLAVTVLSSCSISRAWKGNLVWILAILLCAAYITADSETVHRLIEQYKSGIWVADSARIEGVLKAVRAIRDKPLQPANDAERIVELEEHDTLALLLHPRGVLASS